MGRLQNVLISMTGFGQASKATSEYEVSVEVKAVNNRFLRISTRMPDCISPLEADVERLVRESVARGTVNVNVRITPVGQTVRYHLESKLLSNYWESINAVARSLSINADALAPSLLSLPGVVNDRLSDQFDPREQWPLVNSVLSAALTSMTQFRKAEGQVMSEGLAELCQEMRKQLENIKVRSKAIVIEYRDKLVQRVSELLGSLNASVTGSDVIRDVSIYADRSDINEEITRLSCHIDQFEKLLVDKDSQGRRLDFLSQEMVREINTIGSKMADVQAAHSVVEMKLAAERIKEILQNVE